MNAPQVVQVGTGVFAVTIDGRREIVYVTTPATGARWAFCSGEVFREAAPAAFQRASASGMLLPITAPMPSTVRKILVATGSVVKKGETLLIVEAMKMELPLRASGDATVTAIHCREGELVQPETILVELS